MAGDQPTEIAESTNQRQPESGVTFTPEKYAGAHRWPFESTFRSLTDLYQSVVNPSSAPELENDKVFKPVRDLLFGPKSSIQDFNTGFNQILKDQGLPPVQIIKSKESDALPPGCGIECNPEGSTDGAYISGNGKIRLPERIFDSQNLIRLGVIVMHEANHFTQDILVTRALIDDALKANPQANINSKEFLAFISSKYQERFNITPKDDFLNSVLEMRNGKELSPAERLRADRLTEGRMAKAKDGLLPSARNDLQALKNWTFEIRSGNVAPEDLVRKLIEVADPNFDNSKNSQDWRRILFASDKIKVEDVIQRFGDPNKPDFDRSRAKSELLKLLTSRTNDLRKDELNEFLEYEDYSHEVESRRVGDSFESFLKSYRK
ncbi:MAG: hypothetical protein KIT34_13305 [Cyanobacteria bacterium TGS_CYA1]|nr:hypothetical protein [Cyanobacteria bacterium TGS_CYA1]